ncbi:hypothetical protein Tco_0888079 [Tanacetum coccineum]
MPSFPSSEPTVSYFNDFDYYKDFENEFLAIAYNDALTSKLDFSEPTVSPQHINEFDEISLFECDGEEQNVIYFNDLFPFNVIYPGDLRSDKDNDDDKIDIRQFLEDNVINTDVGAYTQGALKISGLAFTGKKELKLLSELTIVRRITGDWGFATSDKAAGLMGYKLKQQWLLVLLRFVTNSDASILSTAKVVTYYAAVHKKVFWFVFGDDVLGYGCDLIEYFMIMVVVVLLSLVSTASYVLVLPVFTFNCQRKLALFEFKDEFLCYWFSAIKEERKQLYMLRSWKPNYWLTSPIGLKRLNAAQIHGLCCCDLIHVY